jgi:hypothetical protein
MHIQLLRLSVKCGATCPQRLWCFGPKSSKQVSFGVVYCVTLGCGRRIRVAVLTKKYTPELETV